MIPRICTDREVLPILLDGGRVRWMNAAALLLIGMAQGWALIGPRGLYESVLRVLRVERIPLDFYK